MPQSWAHHATDPAPSAPGVTARSHAGARAVLLARPVPHSHAEAMFMVIEADAAAIRAAFEAGGEFSAAVELRRRFPGIMNNGQAQACSRAIAGWTPLPVSPQPKPRRPPAKPR